MPGRDSVLQYPREMVIVFVSLALVRRHIERTPSDLTAVKAGAYSREALGGRV